MVDNQPLHQGISITVACYAKGSCYTIEMRENQLTQYPLVTTDKYVGHGIYKKKYHTGSRSVLVVLCINVLINNNIYKC